MKLPWKKNRYPDVNMTNGDDDSSSSSISIDKSNKLTDIWHNLASRDQIALSLLGLFLFGFFGIYGGLELYKNSTNQQLTFNQKVGDYFWLRSQANNLKPTSSNSSDNQNQTLNIQVSNSLRQAGIENPVVANANNINETNNEAIQFSFENDSQAMVNKAISTLQHQGLYFSKLQITQQAGTQDSSFQEGFRVQATVMKHPPATKKQ